MSIYFLTFHGKPNPESNESEIGGAYINCWIEAEEIDQAKNVAQKKISEANWTVLDLDESYEITREDYSDDTSGLRYYEQAVIDKWVLVYHTYPNE